MTLEHPAKSVGRKMPLAGALVRGGFRHVQHVRPNRGPHMMTKKISATCQHTEIARNNNNNNNKQTFQRRTINENHHKGARGDYSPKQ